MRKFLIVPVLAAILLGTLPYFAGLYAEKSMQEFATQVNQYDGYSAEWKSYDRGWFQSQGEMVITLDMPEVEFVKELGEAIETTFDVELSHGPVLVGVDEHYKNAGETGFGWYDVVARLNAGDQTFHSMITLKEPGSLYTFNGKMSLLGHFEFTDRWQPAKMTSSVGSVETEGYVGAGHISIARELNYQFTMPLVNYVVSDGMFTASLRGLQSQLSADLSKITAANVMPSQFHMSFEEISVPQIALKLENPSVNVITDIIEVVEAAEGLSDASENVLDMSEGVENVSGGVTEMLDTRIETKIPSIFYGEENWQDANLELSYKNISLIFLENYQALVGNMPVDAEPEVLQSELGRIIIEQLLVYSPVAAIDELSIKTAEGKLFVKTSLAVDGSAMAQGNISPMNPLAVMPYVSANAEAAIDEALAQKLASMYIRQQINNHLERSGEMMTAEDIKAAVAAQAPSVLHMLELQNFLRLENNQYAAKFSYEKGQAVVNGNALPLPF